VRVLVAAASPARRRLLAEPLGEPVGEVVEVLEAAGGDETLALLARPDGPRLVLVERALPGLDGLELCRRVRALALAVRPYLLVVDTGDAEGQGLEALRAGADDTLVWPPERGVLLRRVRAGLRNLQLQEAVLARFAQLEATLQRLDAVGVVAAGPEGDPGPPASWPLSRSLWEVKAFRRLPERLEATLERLGQAEGADAGGVGGGELWAHVALALPAQEAWVDLVLSASRARLRSLLVALGGAAAGSDRELGDAQGHALGLLVAGLQHDLDAQGVAFVRPLPPRARPGAPVAAAGDRRLRLERGGCVLTATEAPAPRRQVAFSALQPGMVLLEALRPPGQPQVEVLPRGTWLKASYLQRAKAFFSTGEEPLLEVVQASAFAAAQWGSLA
jgi:CheY-like chemotaxis protein